MRFAPLQQGVCVGQGEAVQVDPMKPKLKPPGSKRLKLNCDDPLSRFAFKFNLRHFNKDEPRCFGCDVCDGVWCNACSPVTAARAKNGDDFVCPKCSKL
jgi:hypothetical protein